MIALDYGVFTMKIVMVKGLVIEAVVVEEDNQDVAVPL